ncbi:hypothetical protein [Dyadobacter sp. NIV53]|uniref:hypothetical protein n=1 Tax=Dyadobacter sp. NIV53 TaxID=2861765 RepID=UPI001C875306|nr:hypothetical protein [Dyadobacter sp. NIV53]
MKSGDRLDQIEPLIVEMLIKIDATSTKVDSLTSEISHLSGELSQLKVVTHRTIEMIDKQNDSISFLLKNQLELNGKIDKIDGKLESMDHKFDLIDHKFDSIDHKFDSIDRKFDSMDSRLDKMEITQQSILAILRNKN